MSTGAMDEMAFKPQLDVVAVEFYDRSRGLVPVHRIAVTFRDGHIEFTDVRPAAHHGVADIFATAIPEAVAQRRTGLLLDAQYQRLRAEWMAEQGG